MLEFVYKSTYKGVKLFKVKKHSFFYAVYDEKEFISVSLYCLRAALDDYFDDRDARYSNHL